MGRVWVPSFPDAPCRRGWLIVALSLAAAFLPAQEESGLLSLELPLRVNGVLRGTVMARIDQATETLHDVDGALLNMLEEFDADKAGLFLDAGFTSAMSPGELEALGISARFDAYNVELSVTVDPGIRRLTRHPLNAMASASGASLREERVGGGLNLMSSANLDLSAPASGGPVDSYASFGLKYEAFLTIHEWILESDGALSFDASSPRYAFGGAVLTHDFRERLLRLQAGTVAYPVLANQIRLPVYGVALHKEPSFDPRYRANSYDAEFFLAKPSEVEILRNGRRVWSDQLPAGPHVVTDIPIDSGMNRVEIRVDGNPSFIDIPFESNLLRGGEWLWGSAAGLLISDLSIPVAAAYARHGFSPSITGEAFLHADLNTQALGSDFTFALPIGGINAALTANHSWTTDIGHRWGAMGQLGYRIQDIGGSGINLSAAMSGKSPWSFAAGEPSTSNLYAFSVRAALSGPLPRTPVRLDGGASMDVAFLPEDTKQYLWAGINSRLGKNGFLALSLRWAPLPAVVSERFRLDLSLSFNFDGPVSETSFRQSLSEPLSSLSARGEVPLSAGGLSWDARIESPLFIQAAPNAEAFVLGGQIQYEGSRLEAKYAHELAYDDDTAEGELWSNRMQAQLDTGLAFAGSSFAWTAPTGRNLIVVRGVDAYREIPVGIPSGGGWAVLTDAFGPVADSGFASYRLRRLEVTPLEIPDGLDPGDTSHALFPGYRSAYSVTLGGKPTIRLSGRLLDAEGKALEFTAASLLPLPVGEGTESDPFAEIRFFTVEDGFFEVDGLEPGSWSLVVSGDRGTAILNIPDSAERNHEAGDIRIEGETP